VPNWGFNPLYASRIPDQSGVRAAWPAGNILFPALLYARGLKPSLATTTAKASERVIVAPLAGKARSYGVDLIIIGMKVCILSILNKGEYQWRFKALIQN